MLQSQQGIKHGNADEMEPEQRHDVVNPALLFYRINAGEPVNAPLDWRERALNPPAAVDVAHDVATERFHHGGDQRGKYGDLCPTLPCHCGFPEPFPVGLVRSSHAQT